LWSLVEVLEELHLRHFMKLEVEEEQVDLELVLDFL
jgi:hypothetical protein